MESIQRNTLRWLRAVPVIALFLTCAQADAQCLASAQSAPSVWQNVLEYLRSKSTGPEVYKQDRIRQLAQAIGEYGNAKAALVRLLDDHLKGGGPSATQVTDAALRQRLPFLLGRLGDLSRSIALLAQNADLGGLTPILTKLGNGLDEKRAISLCGASMELGSGNENRQRMREYLNSMESELAEILKAREEILNYFNKK